jgi:hypothetical protein
MELKRSNSTSSDIKGYNMSICGVFTLLVKTIEFQNRMGHFVDKYVNKVSKI